MSVRQGGCKGLAKMTETDARTKARVTNEKNHNHAVSAYACSNSCKLEDGGTAWHTLPTGARRLIRERRL